MNSSETSVTRQLAPSAFGLFFLFLALIASSAAAIGFFSLLMPAGLPAIVIVALFGWLAVAAFRAAGRRLPRVLFRVSTAMTMAIALILGFLAASVPTLGGSRQREKQKRTMIDIRSIAATLESYAVDHHSLPDASRVADLGQYLEPTYIRKLPREDPWGHDFKYSRRINSDGSLSYFIASAGRDGVWEESTLSSYQRGATTSFDGDVVFSDGELIRYPEGMPGP